MQRSFWRHVVGLAVVGSILGGVAAAAAQEARGGRGTPLDPGSIAGVYAARRVVASTTCATSSPGDVRSTVWVIQWSRAAGYEINAIGGTSFATFTGRAEGGTITLTAQSGGGAATDTMTLTLTRGADGSLSGTETIVVAAQRCSVVRQVSARPIS